MNQWRSSPSNERGTSTRHNIHTRLVQPLVSLSSSVPATPVEGASRDITRSSESATEGRQPLSVDDAHAAQPVSLHAADLGVGQQSVGHEFVAVEDRVVEAPHAPESTPAEKSVADVLRHAALIIEERGWCQNKVGVSGGPVCAIGAIKEADPATGVDAINWTRRLAWKAMTFAERALRLPKQRNGLYRPLSFFNDTPGRTAAEVVAALRAAAEEADR